MLTKKLYKVLRKNNFMTVRNVAQQSDTECTNSQVFLQTIQSTRARKRLLTTPKLYEKITVIQSSG